MLSFGDYNRHWSYYLAIENQLAGISRFVEFSEANSATYSIEFARILLSAASEVDVILRQLCKLLDNDAKADKIGTYQAIINKCLPEMTQEIIYIDRYNIELKPWEIFSSLNLPPTWCTANNKVKHHRHTNFQDASLRNAMHAVGALHILIVYYYKVKFEIESGNRVRFGEITGALQPEANLYSMNRGYYGRTRMTHSEY
jgi:hypothetical protein